MRSMSVGTVRWPCSPKIARFPRAWIWACRSGSRNCSCTGLGSGAHAGWRCELWDQLELGEFWEQRLPASRKGTEWLHVLQTLVCYRLIDPGSEWRLHRYWFDHSAMADLLGEDFKIAQKDTLYRCHDRLLEHKEDLFKHLKGRWETLFDARCEVLLYDLTSTYFESDPPFEDKRQFGYSRDKRSDCVQVVIALVVTPEGFPLGYEVMAGNTADNTTLRGFLEKIETSAWESRAGLGHGSGDSDRRGARGDARGLHAGLLPGGDPQGPLEPLRGGAHRSALGNESAMMSRSNCCRTERMSMSSSIP